MKKILLVALVLFTLLANAQAPPQGISYQAVARGNSGAVLANATLTVRFSIISDIPNNVVEYQEVHGGVVTNAFGLFTLVIGQGTQTGGNQASFSAIPWGTIVPFLKVEANSGAGYIDMGTVQFWSVPYALYAGNGGGTGSGGTGATGAQGPSGPTGPTGPAGNTGIAGPSGSVGATGAQGPIGPTGPTGANGTPGATGPTGNQGFNGNPGPTGPTGNGVGIPGAQGPTGPTGVAGLPGNTGPTGATGATGGLGLNMFSPIDVATGSGATSWVTIDVSAFIPVGAKFVILEAEAGQSGPDSGDTDTHMRIRSATGQPSFLLMRGRSAGADDVIAVSGQGMYPVSANRTFDYIVESPGYDGGYTLRIVGYIF